MSSTLIDVETRTEKGKNESRRLRRSGRIPAILYGAKKPCVPIALSPRDLEHVLRSEAGENSLLHLRLMGKDAKRHAMIKEIQTDPVTGDVVHADFIRIEMDTRVQVSVPVRLAGVAAGVKEQGGVMEIVHRQLQVECLPADIPAVIEVDVSPLRIGDQVRVADLAAGTAYKVLGASDSVIVTVIPPRLVEEKAAETEEAGTVEPEVVGKGKKEEAGETKTEGTE